MSRHLLHLVLPASRTRSALTEIAHVEWAAFLHGFNNRPSDVSMGRQSLRLANVEDEEWRIRARWRETTVGAET